MRTSPDSVFENVGTHIEVLFRLALSCQGRYREAVESYKRAIELDPSNESFKTNLNIAQEKLNEETRNQRSMPQVVLPILAM